MNISLYWIPEIAPWRVAILPRPRGGDWLEDEIRELKRAGVGVLVSLLVVGSCTSGHRTGSPPNPPSSSPVTTPSTASTTSSQATPPAVTSHS